MPTALDIKRLVHQIVLTQRDHCSQDAVIGYQWRCPHVKIVLTTSVLTKGVYCTCSVMYAHSQKHMHFAKQALATLFCSTFVIVGSLLCMS